MTELKLYKFIYDRNVEWHRIDNNGTPDIAIFPSLRNIQEFADLVKDFRAGDGGLEIRLRGTYVVICMKDLCERFEIDMDEIFVGELD